MSSTPVPRVFPEVSWKELGLLMAGSVVICLLLIAVLWMRNRNYHVRRKKAKAVALCCLLPLLLLGCGKQEESILYNSFDHNWAVTERYEVVEHSFQQFSLYDRETGTFQTFPAGAFADNGQTALGFFYLDGNTLYSLSQSTWHERFYRESYDRATALTALDLNTLEERTVYQWNDGSKRFFGLLDRSYSETDPTFGYPFFLYGNTMYFQQDELLKTTDLLTGRTETIMDLSSAANFAFDGERLYYLDAYNRADPPDPVQRVHGSAGNSHCPGFSSDGARRVFSEHPGQEYPVFLGSGRWVHPKAGRPSGLLQPPL